MEFHHIEFVVHRLEHWTKWFIHTLGFSPLEQGVPGTPHRSVWLRHGRVLLRLSAPGSQTDGYGQYLQAHPPGILDVALTTSDLDGLLSHALARGGKLLQPPQLGWLGDTYGYWCRLGGWGSLRHTIVEPRLQKPAKPRQPDQLLAEIDHVVLNVGSHQLQSVARWYSSVFDLHPQQHFMIRTPNSGLNSQVMARDRVQLPINEPTTENSQIQEFIVHNRGAGVQHVALRCPCLLTTVARLRPRGLKQLPVPPRYYQNLQQRPSYRRDVINLQQLQQQQLLVDWPKLQPTAVGARILQTFTPPLFELPTFFFELIERQPYTAAGSTQLTPGFGEANFQALFEVVEQQQRSA